MAKILLYGGCHARILSSYLLSAFPANELEVDLLVNYELIQSGLPFPYELVDRCDVVIYSPVENKGVYNTVYLEEYCRRNGKMTLCFPWIEWQGYSPGAVKGRFKARHQWYYPQLLEIARGFDDFACFRDHVVATFPSDDTIDQVLAKTSEWLSTPERDYDMAIRVSEFINSHHRDARLFLTSDHPSRDVYLHVLRQILDRLGLTPSVPFAEGEPQDECRTPIFPRVAERLHLDFDDTGWADDLLMPGALATLEDYLRLYFHNDGVVLAPRFHADLFRASSIAMPLNATTRVLAVPLAADETAGVDHYEFLATLAGPALGLESRAPFSIEAKLWRSTWESY